MVIWANALQQTLVLTGSSRCDSSRHLFGVCNNHTLLQAPCLWERNLLHNDLGSQVLNTTIFQYDAWEKLGLPIFIDQNLLLASCTRGGHLYVGNIVCVTSFSGYL